jgi:hypothetical protein
MAGATAEDAVPALPGVLRRTTVSIAVVVVVAFAFVILTSGRGATLIDLGLIGLVALLTLGLAGAVHFSPHRGRAVLALVAMVLVLAGSTWFVAQVLGANQS